MGQDSQQLIVNQLRTELCSNKPASRNAYRRLIGTFDYSQPYIFKQATFFSQYDSDLQPSKTSNLQKNLEFQGQSNQILKIQAEDTPIYISEEAIDKSELASKDGKLDSKQYPQCPFPPRQIFELILSHFSKHSKGLPNAARIQYILLQIRQNQPLKAIMEKLDMDDLKRISMHKKILESLQRLFYQLSTSQNKYHAFYHQAYRLSIIEAYKKCQQLDIDKKDLAKYLFEGLSGNSKNYTRQQLSAFINALFSHVYDENNINNTAILNQEDEMINSRIFDIQNQSSVDQEQEDLRKFRTLADKPYDQVSKYGIFRNRREEKQLSKEGVYNWRLHRTMQVLEKYGIINPHSNIKSARNIAVFVIKLTDRHIQTIFQKTMTLAKIALRSRVQGTEVSEFTYFRKRRNLDRFGTVEKFEQNYGQYQINRLIYPNHYHIYRKLRRKQFYLEQKLYQILKYEVPSKACEPKPKPTKKYTKTLLDYFQPPPIYQLLEQIDQDEQYQQKTKNSKYMHMHIQPRHIVNAIENHPFYKKHLVLWRIKTVYY